MEFKEIQIFNKKLLTVKIDNTTFLIDKIFNKNSDKAFKIIYNFINNIPFQTNDFSNKVINFYKKINNLN